MSKSFFTPSDFEEIYRKINRQTLDSILRPRGDMWEPQYRPDDISRIANEKLSTIFKSIPPSKMLPKFNEAINLVYEEYRTAVCNFPPMNSAHEAYAVLLEEVDELWSHVKTNQKKRDLEQMRSEAKQVAAMAIRFMIEVCDEERGRK